MKKILVLGGTGFVGRQVCEQLTRLGWQITVPTRRAVNDFTSAAFARRPISF